MRRDLPGWYKNLTNCWKAHIFGAGILPLTLRFRVRYARIFCANFFSNFWIFGEITNWQ